MEAKNVNDSVQDVRDFLCRAEKPLIVIVGPTASGKTGFSIALAEALREGKKGEGRGAEVVNADSRQLYRFLDIGTAKPSVKEMRGIPHHLLSVCDPKQEVTAAWYKARAKKAIDAVHARGNVPILVGGSMLYVSAIVDDLRFLPTVDPRLRAALEAEYDKDKGDTLYRKLQETDPDSACRIHPRNKPYVVRAMEILETLGKPSKAKVCGTCPYTVLMLGMEWPRMLLVKRIDERTRQLLRSGWIDEVRALLVHGYTQDDPGMVSYGYREIMSHLQTGVPNLKELEEEIAAATRQYSKRQMTWWRKDRRIRWIDVAKLQIAG